MKSKTKRYGLILTRVLCLALGLCIFAGCNPGEENITITPDSESSPGSETSSSDSQSSNQTSSPDSQHSDPMLPPDGRPEDLPPVRTEAIKRDNITLNAFLIHMTDPEQRQKMMRLCAEADIDVLSHTMPVFSWPYDTSHNTREWFMSTMTEASQYGLLLQVKDTETLASLSLTDEELRKLAETYKDLPGFGGFSLADEPRNPSPYARVENTLREVCPDTFIEVNFMPEAGYDSWDTYIRQLCDYGGLLKYGGTLSLDTYDFKENGSVDEASMFGNYEHLRTAGLCTGTNTAVYVGSVGMTGICRRPSQNDLRYNMMAALAYGVKEIKFFTWAVSSYRDDLQTTAILDWDNEPTDLYYAVKDVNKKIHTIGKFLAACDAAYVYHGKNHSSGAYKKVPGDLFVQSAEKDVIISLMEERGGVGEYVFVVNKDIEKEQPVTLTFAGMDKVFVVSDVTGELTETALDGGKITLTLAAGDGALIKLPEGDFIKPAQKKNANLALNAPVFGSSSVGEGDYYLYNLTDGIKGTAAAARLLGEYGKTQYLTVDLGDVRSVNRVDIYPAGEGAACGFNNPRNFSIMVSADGANWTEVVKNTEELARDYVPVFRFDSVEARFVSLRIDMPEGSGLASCVDIAELMVYNDDGKINDKIKTSYKKIDYVEGGNIALNKPVVAYSSTLDIADWGSYHTGITDGNINMTWTSALYAHNRPEATEWIVVDLLGVFDLTSITLVPRQSTTPDGGNTFPVDYEIQVSLDGVNFEPAVTVTGDNVPFRQDDRIFTIDGVPARFIRLYATRLTYHGSNDTGYGIAIGEMEVYGKPHTS